MTSKYGDFFEEDIVLEGNEDNLRVGVSTSNYCYRQEDGTGAYCYIRNSYYYADRDCTRKLKKVWLYSSRSCDDSHRIFYLNQNGKPVKGFTKIDGVKYLFDKETGRFSTATGTHKAGGKLYYIKGGFVPVYVNADGSVSAGTVTRNGKTIHLNKYGVCIEDYSIIRKSGKNWYFNNADSAGSAQVRMEVADFKKFKAAEKDAVITWDDNMKISKIVDAETGKGITGICTFYNITIGSTTTQLNYVYSLKNGVPVTGAKTITVGIKKVNLSFDPDTARLAMYSFAEQIR